jgi:hypothetical protein
VPSLFKQHNYKHESLDSAQIDEIMASGNATAIKVALYALTLEGVLHQIADHNPPKGWDHARVCGLGAPSRSARQAATERILK